MFAGHIGAGLALARAEPRVNAGLFVTAALLLDLVLWLLVLLGLEKVSIPSNFASTHQPEFEFPYSHSLLGALAWSGVAAAACAVAFPRLRSARGRIALLIAAAVFSHWLLDWLVHQPELPLAGNDSLKTGAGLWQNLPLALSIETAMAIIGLLIFLGGRTLSRGRSIALSILVVVLSIFTIAGMTLAPPPPSPQAMAGSSFVFLALVCALTAYCTAISKGPTGNPSVS